MAKNIENNIRIKAVLIYLLVAIAVASVVIYIYGIRTEIQDKKSDIEKQHIILSLTNDLIYTVNKAQTSVSMYITTKNSIYAKSFKNNIMRVDSIIDSLNIIHPVDEDILIELGGLLTKQEKNLDNLNRILSNKNPVSIISEKLQEIKPEPKHDTAYVFKVRRDTVIRKPPKKKFFRRIAEVFKPSKDSIVTVSKQRIDTIMMVNNDSLPIISEVDNIAKTASLNYERNIKSIEKNIATLISSDQAISGQISTILLNLHKQTLDSTMLAVKENENTINRNFTFSIIAGIIALGLILLFIVMIITDVNKGKAARERIQDLMESRHKLLLSVSHDIKSPLNSILGYLELWKNKGLDVGPLENSGKHILSLLENLLEFSSLEQGKLQVSHGKFHLKNLCEEIYEMFLPMARKKNLELKVYCKSETIINSDYVKIKQVIINLVSNAVKYTTKGEVELKAGVEGNELIIEVNDTGVGIPGDELDNIYNPFMRVENNSNLANGSGLGLFVIKGIIELLDGCITASSEVGKGTSINISIPVETINRVKPSGTKKIAVIDDDPAVELMAKEMLESLGHKVVKEGYEIILTDMDMGAISGTDILKKAGNIPVILMTGQADFTSEDATAIGFSGYISKPFSIESLRMVFGGTDNNMSLTDGDYMDEVMEIFRAETTGNMIMLKDAINENDFNKAQKICHKMYPMFAQLGYPSELLRKIDSRRGNPYENWQNDVEEIINICGRLDK